MDNQSQSQNTDAHLAAPQTGDVHGSTGRTAAEGALGCNYEAPTFGAHYPDGTCIEGYMWDLDSCDEPGGSLCSGGDIPCPWCNTPEYIEHIGIVLSGSAHQRRIARRAHVRTIRAWAEARSSFAP